MASLVGDKTMKVLNFINGFNPQMNSELNVGVIKMTHYVKVLTYLKPHDLRRPTWWKQNDSSDLYTYGIHVPPPPQNKENVIFKKHNGLLGNNRNFRRWCLVEGSRRAKHTYLKGILNPKALSLLLPISQ